MRDRPDDKERDDVPSHKRPRPGIVIGGHERPVKRHAPAAEEPRRNLDVRDDGADQRGPEAVRAERGARDRGARVVVARAEIREPALRVAASRGAPLGARDRESQSERRRREQEVRRLFQAPVPARFSRASAEAGRGRSSAEAGRGGAAADDVAIPSRSFPRRRGRGGAAADDADIPREAPAARNRISKTRRFRHRLGYT